MIPHTTTWDAEQTPFLNDDNLPASRDRAQLYTDGVFIRLSTAQWCFSFHSIYGVLDAKPCVERK